MGSRFDAGLGDTLVQTVMPHNLYLHSSISQTRKVDYEDPADVCRAVRFMTWDSNMELTLAFAVNSAGPERPFLDTGEEIALSSMYDALQTMPLQELLQVLFCPPVCCCLVSKGQNSTITGTQQDNKLSWKVSLDSAFSMACLFLY